MGIGALANAWRIEKNLAEIEALLLQRLLLWNTTQSQTRMRSQDLNEGVQAEIKDSTF